MTKTHACKRKHESKWPRHEHKTRKGKGRVNLRHGVAVVEDDHSVVILDNLIQVLLRLALDDDRSDLSIACHSVGVCIYCCGLWVMCGGPRSVVERGSAEADTEEEKG